MCHLSEAYEFQPSFLMEVKIPPGSRIKIWSIKSDNSKSNMVIYYLVIHITPY